MEKRFGQPYPANENAALFAFTLEDCYFLERLVDSKDDFHGELWQAIEWLEERNKSKTEGSGISIVVTDEGIKMEVHK